MSGIPVGSGGVGGGGDVVGFSGNGGGSSSGGEQACATDSAKAELSSEPVDVIVVLDNSGSMADEMQAAEDNINLNFAQVLDGASIDYRVILLSRHRKEARTASEEASTSICVSQPLSGLATCPSPLVEPRPVGAAGGVVSVLRAKCVATRDMTSLRTDSEPIVSNGNPRTMTLEVPL